MPIVSRLPQHPTRDEQARRARDVLRTTILGGSFGRGALPPEAELMLALGVSRNALRVALDQLRREGLIDRIQGCGTFVVSSKTRHRFDRLSGLAEDLDEGRSRVRGEIITIARIPAHPTVAAELDVAPGTQVVYSERLQFLDNAPWALWASYLAPWVDGGLLDDDLARDFYNAVLDHVGLPVSEARIVIEAVAADDAVAKLLDVPVAAPLLLFERTTLLSDGRPVEFGYVRCRGDRMVLTTCLARTHATKGS